MCTVDMNRKLIQYNFFVNEVIICVLSGTWVFVCIVWSAIKFLCFQINDKSTRHHSVCDETSLINLLSIQYAQ